MSKNYDESLPLFQCRHYEARHLAGDLAMEALGVIGSGDEKLAVPRAYKAGFEMTRSAFDMDRQWYSNDRTTCMSFLMESTYKGRSDVVHDGWTAHRHAVDIVSYALRAEPMILDEFKAGVNGGAANLDPLVKAVLDDEGMTLSVKRIDGRDSWDKSSG